jgi:hypothetical protein
MFTATRGLPATDYRTSFGMLKSFVRPAIFSFQSDNLKKSQKPTTLKPQILEA